MLVNSNHESKNSQSISRKSLRIVIATSELNIVDTILSQVQHTADLLFRICSNESEILKTLEQDSPDLLILGKVQGTYWFELCFNCREKSEKLPILLLAESAPIDNYFCRWAAIRGASEVMSSNAVELNKFLAMHLPTETRSEDNSRSANLSITGEMAIAAFLEINEISKTFFGPLALGNYWRKAHTIAIDKCPKLHNWSADHFGMISCYEAMLDEDLTEQELKHLGLWIRLFIQEGERVKANFGEILLSNYASPPLRKLFANI
jgi:hypothetical protein